MGMIQTDGRGRATLPVKNAVMRVTELDGGALLLEPAQLYTEAELEMLHNAGLREQVRQNSASGEAVPRRRRGA